VLAGIGIVLLVALGSLPAGAFVTQVTVDVVDDFSGGVFDRTGLINLPSQGVSGVQLMPIGLSGEWVQDTRTLPISLQETVAVAYGDYVYLLGGRMADGQATNRVFYLRVNRADGSVAQVGECTSRLLVPVAGASAFVYVVSGQPYVYVIGGAPISTYGGWTPTRKVARAAINTSTGMLGGFIEQQAALLEYGLYYSALAVRDRDVLLLGGMGYIDGFFMTSDVMHARLSETGELGAWRPLLDEPGWDQWLPEAVAAGAAALHNADGTDTVYLIGGLRPGDQGDALGYKVLAADFGEDGNGDLVLSAWRNTGADLPVALHGHGAVVIGGEQVLLSGGRTTSTEDTGLERSVKATLFSEAGTNLYDWCQGQPGCTIGYWQTGELLPERRAYHGMVQVGNWVYAVGGSNAGNQPTNTIFRGSIAGVAAVYAPSGTYESAAMAVGGELRRLEWDSSVPSGTSLTLQYAWSAGSTWSDWLPASPYACQNGHNVLLAVPPVPSVQQVRYRLSFTGNATYTASPLLERLSAVYDASPAELGITLSASKTHVRPGDMVLFTNRYSNSGAVSAQSARLVNTLPPQMSCPSCCPTCAWKPLGGNAFEYTLTVVAPGSGQVNLSAYVGQIPEGVLELTDQASISYPAMIDLDGNSVTDPRADNDSASLSVSAEPLAILGTVSAAPAGGSPVSPGQEVEYRLDYSISGGDGTTGVILSAAVGGGKLTDVQALDGGALEGSTVRWYIPGALPAGYAGAVRFRARVARPLANGLTIPLSFVASSDQLPAETVASIWHSVLSSPSLRLSVAAEPAAPGPVNPGQTVTYTLSALNDGGMTAVGVSVSAVLDGLNVVSSDPPGQTSGQTVSWVLGDLGLDTPATLKIVARVADNVVHGQGVTLGATLTGTAVPGAEATTTHTVSVPAAVVLTKGVGSSVVKPGEALVYTLTLSNTGGESTGAITLLDWLPLYTSGPGGGTGGSTLRWQLPPLAGGQSTAVSYQAVVDDPLSETVHYVEGVAASASAGALSARSGTLSTPVAHSPNLWLSLSDGTNVVRPGQQLTYAISYGNRGGLQQGGAIEVSLGDYLLWHGGAGWETLGNGRYRYNIGALDVGASGTASFEASVSPTVPTDDPTLGLRAEATIAGLKGDGDGFDNSSSDTDILCGTDLAVVSLAVQPVAPTGGQRLTLTVHVANLGVDGPASYATVAGTSEAKLEVYIKPSVSAPPTGPLDHVGGYCPDSACVPSRPAFRQSLSLTGLGPGQTQTLSFTSLASLESGLYDVYAQIDTEGDSYWGGFREANEENNLFAMRRFFVADLAWGPLTRFLPIQVQGIVR